jgi:hypothetical protein
MAASTGATTKELMRRAGNSSPVASLRYQHATEAGDKAIADAMGGFATGAEVITMSEANALRFSRTKRAR